MYEKFTDRALHVMQVAEECAALMGHSCVGTGDLLIGLLKEESSIAGYTLKDLGMDIQKAHAEISKLSPPVCGCNPMKHRPQSLGLAHVINNAVDRANDLKHSYIGTEHLLLGLVELTEGVAVEVFETFKITPDVIKQRVLDLLKHPQADETELGVNRAKMIIDKIKLIVSKDLDAVTTLREIKGFI